jgi:small conductance mechanosensitive channel
MTIDSLVNLLTGFLTRLLAAVVIFVVSFLLARFIERILKGFLSRSSRLSVDLAQLVAQVTSITIVVFGVVTALGTMGVDTKALVAGLGLTGFALGFALKDAISNFLAGFLIMFYEPFRRGDLIQVGDHTGTVMEINLRYTVLDAENQRVLIPNANMLTNAVIVKRGGNPEQHTAPGKS